MVSGGEPRAKRIRSRPLNIGRSYRRIRDKIQRATGAPDWAMEYIRATGKVVPLGKEAEIKADVEGGMYRDWPDYDPENGIKF